MNKFLDFFVLLFIFLAVSKHEHKTTNSAFNEHLLPHMPKHTEQ